MTYSINTLKARLAELEKEADKVEDLQQKIKELKAENKRLNTLLESYRDDVDNLTCENIRLKAKVDRAKKVDYFAQ